MLIGLFLASLSPLLAIGVTIWAIKNDTNEPIDPESL